MVREPVLLTVAGSDSGGGAGIQADLKAFWDHGFVGASAITAITAQNTQGVTRIDPVPVDGVRAQIDAIFDDMNVAAVKVGMLGTADLTALVASALADRAEGIPVVLDPVMVATSGDRLLDADAVDTLVSRLVPLATVVTPNLPEAAILTGLDEDAPRAELMAGLARLDAAVLVTGGDADDVDVVDTLAWGGVTRTWRLPRLDGGPFHGTGCTLSSALAAALARGADLESACDQAIAYVRSRLACAVTIGTGPSVGGPLNPPV